MRFKFLGCGFISSKFLKCIDMSSFRKRFKLIHRTFFYNELTNTDSVADMAFNPLFWLVDNFAYYFGIVRSPFVYKSFFFSFNLLFLLVIRFSCMDSSIKYDYCILQMHCTRDFH